MAGEAFAMVNVPPIVRYLSASLCGLVLTWFVIHIPGEYAYASAWLVPTLAAFFALATWFALACLGMDPSMVLVGKSHDSDQRRYGHLCMTTVFDSIGKVCIGVGVLSALIQTMSSPTHCSWEFPFAMGVGILIGAKALGKIAV
jgi:hypothetical protein